MSNLRMHNLCHGVLTFKLVMPWCNSSKCLPPKELSWCLVPPKMGRCPYTNSYLQVVEGTGWWILSPQGPIIIIIVISHLVELNWSGKKKERGIQLRIRIGFIGHLGWTTLAIRMLVWAICHVRLLSFFIGGKNREEPGFRLGTSMAGPWASVRMVKA